MQQALQRFNWQHKAQKCFVTGRLFDRLTGRYYAAEDLLNYFDNTHSVADFVKKLGAANGNFAVVLQCGKQWLCAVDRLRTLPLFYAETPQGVVLSDDAYWLRDQMAAPAQNKRAQMAYWETGWVPGEETVYLGLKQLAAGQYWVLEDEQVTVDYYVAPTLPQANADWDVLWQSLATVSEQTFDRLLDVLKGRTAVVPLSAGWDSRYILIALKKRHYEPVICFSYGEPNQHEGRIAQKIAQKFNYPFYSVPYRHYKDLTDRDQLTAYLRYAYHYTGLPHIQDFFAVAHLHRINVLPKDSVFLPGHSGDLLGGSWLRKQLKQFPPELPWPERVWRQHCVGLPQTNQAALLAYFKQQLPTGGTSSDVLLAEQFNVLNRQSKFIINAVRVYEFFGYDWYLPLWDAALVAFWDSVPLSFRTEKILYRHYLQDFFQSFHVTDFQLKITNPYYWQVLPAVCYQRFHQPTGWQWQRLIQYLHTLLPTGQAVPQTKDINLLLRYVLSNSML